MTFCLEMRMIYNELLSDIRECSLGNLVSDAINEAAKTNCKIENGGNIIILMKTGNLTR